MSDTVHQDCTAGRAPAGTQGDGTQCVCGGGLNLIK